MSTGSLRLWHRYLGLLAAVLAIVLSTTGLLLQHAPALGLDHRHVAQPWLLDLYDIKPPPVVSVRAGSHWVSQAGERLYLDDKPVPGQYGGLAGAVETPFGLAVVSGGTLILLSLQGTVLDRLAEDEGLPGRILSIARTTQGVMACGEAQCWTPDDEFLHWQAQPFDPHITTGTLVNPPPKLAATIAQHAVGHELIWERVLLDVHAGRLLGRLGTLVMDLAAIVLLFLAISGLVIWFKTKRRPKQQVSLKPRTSPLAGPD